MIIIIIIGPIDITSWPIDDKHTVVAKYLADVNEHTRDGVETQRTTVRSARSTVYDSLL